MGLFCNDIASKLDEGGTMDEVQKDFRLNAPSTGTQASMRSRSQSQSWSQSAPQKPYERTNRISDCYSTA